MLIPCREKSPLWWGSTKEIDDDIAAKFAADLAQLDSNREAYASWVGHDAHPRAGLALTVLIDQMSRNMFRGSGQAFAYDDIARSAARATLSHPLIDQIRPAEV